MNDSKDKYNLLGMGTILNEQQNNITFFEKDTIGGQFGHVVLSMLMFNKVKPVDEVDLVLINRIIATHHGSINFGSIKPSETKFEYLINICDKIGALFCGENKRIDLK